MEGTMVVNGVRAAYSMTPTDDGAGIVACIRYGQRGPWEGVGPPGTFFATAAEARAAIRSQIAANMTRVLGLM
ncbi:hypothetical protein RAS14_00055 [Achromobacter aegrifaciens]|uniref:hypothetical protein n=1 Tax=Achromobacter TaxID=222 RepID=UPI001266E0F6|nr:MULTISPECIES: hypothetical protein [Achromobacter]MDQ1758122.1 hypothetical protein [Achromobacter aegrifaciens]